MDKKKNSSTYYEDLLSKQATELLKKGLSTQEIFQELHLQNEKITINLSSDLNANAVPLHSHRFYELLFILDGSIDYLIGSYRYQLKSNDVVILPPGIAHQPLIFEPLKIPYKRFSLWIDTAYIHDILEKYPDAGLALKKSTQDKKYIIRTNELIWHNLRAQFENIYRESIDMKPGWKLCVTTEVLNLITHLSRIYYSDTELDQSFRTNSLMDNILSHIDIYLSEKLTLENVAKTFHISTSKLSHMFKEELGVSFYQCIVQRRLIAIKNAVLQGVSLKEATAEFGFLEYSSFYRIFKKEYGISPRDYFAFQQTLTSNIEKISPI